MNLNHFCQSIINQCLWFHTQTSIFLHAQNLFSIFSIPLITCDLEKFISINRKHFPHLLITYIRVQCAPLGKLDFTHLSYTASIPPTHTFCSPSGQKQFLMSFPSQTHNTCVFICSINSTFLHTASQACVEMKRHGL